MYCRKCYADLDQAVDSSCARCGRQFSAQDPSSYLNRPFPSIGWMIVHSLITLTLATIVSVAVAFFLALAQLKFIHSGH